MFSSDVAKIRLAELKAKGNAGTIQRLRKTCDDAAGIFDATADIVLKKGPKTPEGRDALVQMLRRGAKLLRSTAWLSPPEGAK